MSDVAPSKDVFVALMAAAKDPWYTMVIYRAWLERADPEEPLWRTPYFGQAVRSGTAEENFKDRKREHELKSARDDKDLGFLAVIGRFGPDAIAWEIVASKSGPRTAMRECANAEEKRLIAENGGVLRDMDDRLKQTLNLTKGGQGDARAVWAAIDARHRHALTKFKRSMEKYVAEHGTALVPHVFVDANKYPLGVALSSFRQGRMRKGMPDEAESNAWADALPHWAWDARETDEYREGCVQRGKDQWTNESFEKRTYRLSKSKATMATDASKEKRSKIGKDQWANASKEKRAEWAKANSAAQLLPEVRAKRVQSGKDQWANASETQRAAWSQSSKDQWTNASEEKRAEWAKSISDAQRRPEVRAKHVQSGKDQWSNASAEQKAERLAKTKATMATDASKAKRSKLAMAQRAAERRAELERARPIAVPFEKIRKRRVEMRAAATDFSGKFGNAVLYMVSEDGATIRRVTTRGDSGKVEIVGPVVDPVPPDAFDLE